MSFRGKQEELKVKEGKQIKFSFDKLVIFLEHSNLLPLIATTKMQGRNDIRSSIPAILIV